MGATRRFRRGVQRQGLAHARKVYWRQAAARQREDAARYAAQLAEIDSSAADMMNDLGSDTEPGSPVD